MANSFIRKFSGNIGNTATKVGNYTVEANLSTIVLGLTVSNRSSTIAYADIYLSNANYNSFYLIKNSMIPAGGALIPIGGDQKVVLQTGDSIRVRSSNNSIKLDAILSGLEQDSTAGRGSEYVRALTFSSNVLVGNAYAHYDTLYDSASDRVVVGYGSSVGFWPTVIVGEVVDNTVTFGTPVTYDQAEIQSGSIAMDTTNNKLIAWMQSGYVKVGVIHPGNNSVSFGDPVEFDSGLYIQQAGDIAYDSHNNRVVVVYEKGLTPADTYAVVGEVSGFNITFGDPVLVQADTDTIYGAKIDYIPSAQRIAVTYNLDAGYSLNTKIGYVTGNTVIFGNAVVADAGDTYGPRTAVTSTGALAIAYTDYSAAPYPTKVVAGTVSGNIITFGANIVAVNYEQSYVSMDYWAGENVLVVTGIDEANLEFSNVAIVNVSGTTLTLDSETRFFGGQIDRRSSGTSVGGEDNFILVYNDYDDSYKTKALLMYY